MTTNPNPSTLWYDLNPSLQSLLEHQSHYRTELSTLPPPSKEFQDLQTTLANHKEKINQAHTIHPLTSLRQERLTSAQTTLDDLLEKNHKLFLHYHNQHETLAKLIEQWPTEQNESQKETLLEHITSAAQTYLNNSFFDRTLLPFNYPINQHYCELAYLAQENNTLVEEYSSLTSNEQFQTFAKKIEKELHNRQKHRSQLVQDFHLIPTQPLYQIITQLTTNFIERIEKEISSISQNLQSHIYQKQQLNENIKKIKNTTNQIHNTPYQLSEEYVLSLNAIAQETEANIEYDLLYLRKDITTYQKNKNELNRVIHTKKEEISKEINKKIAEISTNIEKLSAADLTKYHQETRQLHQYTTLLQHKQLEEKLVLLEQKINRYMRFYFPSHNPAIPEKNNTNNKSSILPFSEQYTTHTKTNAEKQENDIPFPPINNTADLLDFAYHASQHTTDEKLREFCLTLAGYDGKRYNEIPLSVRVQQAKTYQIYGLNEKDKIIYIYLMQNLN